MRNLKGAIKSHSEKKGVDLRWRLLLLGTRDVGVAETWESGTGKMLIGAIKDCIKFVKKVKDKSIL